MIEVLIIATCLNSSHIACESAAVSYYKHAGIEQVLEEKQKIYISKYPFTTKLIAYGALVAQGRLVLSLGNGNYFTAEPARNTIGYKGEF